MPRKYVREKNRQAALETFRLEVLGGMDQAAKTVFLMDIDLQKFKGQEGATDADLPELFTMIDAQFERLSQRYNAKWKV